MILTITKTSYTFKQKRCKVTIKEQNPTSVIVKKIFNTTELSIRKALSMSFNVVYVEL